MSFPLGPPLDGRLTIEAEMKGAGRKMKKNIIGSLNGIQYIGMYYDDNNWKRNLNTYALGILDEENNTMTAIPVDHIIRYAADISR